MAGGRETWARLRDAALWQGPAGPRSGVVRRGGGLRARRPGKEFGEQSGECKEGPGGSLAASMPLVAAATAAGVAPCALGGPLIAGTPAPWGEEEHRPIPSGMPCTAMPGCRWHGLVPAYALLSVLPVASWHGHALEVRRPCLQPLARAHRGGRPDGRMVRVPHGPPVSGPPVRRPCL